MSKRITQEELNKRAKKKGSSLFTMNLSEHKNKSKALDETLEDCNAIYGNFPEKSFCKEGAKEEYNKK